VLGFLTQSLEDIFKSPIGLEIIQACVTQYFMPNPAALKPEILKLHTKIGLTERQTELIAYAEPKQEYYFWQQRGQRLCSAAFGPATLAFCGRSRPEDLAQIAEIEATRTDPFAVAWLRDAEQPALAGLLEEAYDTYATEPRRVAAGRPMPELSVAVK